MTTAERELRVPNLYNVYRGGPGSFSPIGQFTSFKEASRFIRHALKSGTDEVTIRRVSVVPARGAKP